MFSNFAWSEMLVIAAVAIIVVGPKDLPGMLRQLGKTIGGVKRMAGDFQRQFNDAIKEADLDDIKDLTSTKGFGPLEDARKHMEDFTQSMNDPLGSETGEVDELEAPAVTAEKPAATAKKPAPAKKAAAAKKPAAKTSAKPTTTKTAAPRKTAAKKPAAKKPAAKKAPAVKAEAGAKSAT